MKFRKLSEAIADNGFNNMDKNIVTSDTKAEIEVPYQIGDAVQSHIRKRAEIEDSMKEKDKEVDELEKENQVDSHKEVKTDDLKKMKLSEDLFEAFEDDAEVDDDKYSKYFDETGKLKPELADEYFALTDGVEESLHEDYQDGWPEDLADLSVFTKLDRLIYELQTSVRGAYTKAKTLDQLSNYIQDLADELSDVAARIEAGDFGLDEGLKKNLTEALEDQYEDLYDQIYCNLTMSGSPTISSVVKGVYPPDRIGVDYTSKPGKYGIVVTADKPEKLDKARKVAELFSYNLEKAGRSGELETKHSSFNKTVRTKDGEEEVKRYQFTIFVPEDAEVIKFDKPIKEDVEGEKSEKEELDATPNTPNTPDEFGTAGLINALIQDEWQAIQGYNDAIATLSTTDVDTDIINVFKDIANEENIHIGQLQKALEMVSPNVSSISDGEQEGAKQLEEPDTDMWG
mgnify:CR=1 FL=1